MSNFRISLYQYLSTIKDTYTSIPIDASLPCIRMTRITRSIVHSIEGNITVYEDLWQIDAYADTLLEADTLSRSIIAGLDGFRGEIGTNTTVVESVLIKNIKESQEKKQDSEEMIHRVMMEASCIVHE